MLTTPVFDSALLSPEVLILFESQFGFQLFFKFFPKQVEQYLKPFL